jgi:ATP-binding cassette subfamily F protein 3
MIDFQNVYKSFGSQEILSDVSFRINKNERVGFVGPNGAGKSTVFSIITEETHADKGEIHIPGDARIGYLHQHLSNKSTERHLVDYVSDAVAEINELRQEIHRQEAQYRESKSETEKEKLLNRIGHLQSRFEQLGAYELRVKAEAALSGLGFQTEDFSRPLSTFSGGWQMRANLARTLIANPDILLLDEPSNYLDVPAIEWLQKYLRSFNGTLLLVSHDRYLLQSITNITLEINGGMVTRFPGDYDFYVRERDNRNQQLEAAKKNQDRQREQMEKNIERFRAKNTKAAQAQSWMKKLDKLEDIKVPQKLNYSGTISIPKPPHCGSEIIRLENAGLSYDGEKWILKKIELTLNRGDKIGIVGYNGMGKTTLLRILSGQKDASEGKRLLGHKVVIGYQAQEFSEILPENSSAYDIVKNAAPEGSGDKEVRGTLGNFGFSGDSVHKPCSVLSGGEKIRLAFARIFINPPNFLILDEPTTHLDIAARETLQQAIADYQGTVCLVSHDIEFIRKTAKTIIAMERGGIKKYFGNYDYYLEKSNQSPVTTSTPQKTDAPVSKDVRKARRQERAAKRQEIQKDKKKAERLVEKIETQLENLEAEQLQITEELSVESTAADFMSLNRKLREIQDQITELTSDWETAAENLEAINVEYDKIHTD